MTTRVCHVCNAHGVDDGRVFHRTCVTLVKAGYEVHLIAVDKEAKEYCKQGVFIHPVAESTSRLSRVLRRKRVVQMAAELKPDLFHVHEPELLGSVLAVSDSRAVVYDVHESYLDVLSEREWIPRWLKPMARVAWDRRERQLVQRCSGVVVVTGQIARRYYGLHNIVAVVSNYPDLSRMQDLPPVTRDGVTCVFAGLLRPDRGILEAFRALAIMKKKGLAVSLRLAGRPVSAGYLNSLWAEAERLGISDLVDYRGILSNQEAMALQQQASIGLVTYLPVANSMASLPNKLLECMALGIPVVFSNFPNYREIAGTCRAGISVDPKNPMEIASAIEYLIRNPKIARNMGSAGRRCALERFNWSVESEKLLNIYQRIVGLGCRVAAEPSVII